MSKRMQIIENIKTVSIVVLVISTILLLYFLWANNPLAIFQETLGSDEDIEPVLASDVILPDKIIIGYGADNYAALREGRRAAWNDMTAALDAFANSGNIVVSSVSYADFLEVRVARSIWAEFKYDMPFSGFCAIYGLPAQTAYDQQPNFSMIGYSDVSPESVFLCNAETQECFRLVAESADPGAFNDLLEKFASEENPPYYPLGMYMGVENRTMSPLEMEEPVISIGYRGDMRGGENEQVTDMAKNFFGDSFDFVRKITEESGTIVYMYGYGRKVLTVYTDGIMEYKQEIANEGARSFSDALNLAVTFLSRHGSLASAFDSGVEIYLENIGCDFANKALYRFNFGIRVANEDVYYDKGYPFVVEVNGGQVTYYERDMISCTVSSSEPTGEDVISPVNILASNYQYIYDTFLQERISVSLDTAKPPEDAIFEEVAKSAADVSFGYLRRTDDSKPELRPVWIIEIKDVNFFFDLNSAEPLGYQVLSPVNQ